MSLVGERSILVVIFDDRTTIGMVRLYARETSTELAKIFDQINEKNKNSGEQPIDQEFTEMASDKLDDIFQD